MRIRLLSLSLLALGASAGDLSALKVEYLSKPMGLDVRQPRFSWQMRNVEGRRGQHQRAYRIRVTDETGRLVWNSGTVKASESHAIRYAGKDLMPTTRYGWSVQVWDDRNRCLRDSSWFETGLMNPSIEAWEGAGWIGGGDEDLVLLAPYLPVFRLQFTLTLDQESGSTRAGFVYGANDRRLLDRNMNLFQLQNRKDESYVMAEVDASPLLDGKPARLNLYRSGYHPKDNKQVPVKSLEIPRTLMDLNNRFDPHTFHLRSNLGWTTIHLDGTDPAHCLGEFNLNPTGRGGDAFAYPVLGEIGSWLPEGQTASFTDVRICHMRSPSNLLRRFDWPKTTGAKGGSLRLSDPSRNAMPMLRTTFSVKPAAVVKARLYATARGIYDLYLNGRRVNDDYFNPGLSQYDKTHFYQTFDVTRWVKPGKNALGAILGEGWWSGGSTYQGDYWNTFGDRQSLLLKLVLEYSDGSREVVASRPSTWTYFADGPLVYGSFFQGEVYDATKEAAVDGWSTADFDDRTWHPAVEVSTQGTVSREGEPNRPAVDDFSRMRLVGQYDSGVSAVQTLTARSVNEVRPGVFVYDMGQNMVGVPEIRLEGLEPGRQVVLRYAEVTYPDLPAYRGHEGMIMLENLRAAMVQDVYTAKGGQEVVAPRFTFRGYRYVEITGIDAALPLEAVKGTVLSSVHGLTAGFETSEPLLNRLWQNIGWSMKGNFLSIPTDCPQRNERLGWSGDLSVFARTASYLGWVPQFLRRHMQAMRDVQRADGRFTDVAPLGGGFGEVLWGSAGITVPWESYQQYGDRDMLEEHYPAMKRYVEYLERAVDPSTGVLFDRKKGDWDMLGDWLSPQYGKVEKTLLWEAYFIEDLDIMAKVAGVLGHPDDQARFARRCNERKRFFERTYLDEASGKTVFRGNENDTQTSYALPLAFGILSPEKAVRAGMRLAEAVSRPNRSDDGLDCPPFSLMTGFIGTAWIGHALSASGRSDLAYRMLLQKSYPSWLYPVEQGATTVWERLNSYTKTDGFGGNNGMNSFNHYAFGAVGAWMCDHAIGMVRDERFPGFKHFYLSPEPDSVGDLTFAKGFCETLYGRVESGWTRVGDGFDYDFVVPANTSATLTLRTDGAARVTESDGPLEQAKGVRLIRIEPGRSIYELSSGSYHIGVHR